MIRHSSRRWNTHTGQSWDSAGSSTGRIPADRKTPHSRRPEPSNRCSSEHRTPGGCTMGYSTTASCTPADNRTVTRTLGHSSPNSRSDRDRHNSTAEHDSPPSTEPSSHHNRASSISNLRRPDPCGRSSMPGWRPPPNRNAACCLPPMSAFESVRPGPGRFRQRSPAVTIEPNPSRTGHKQISCHGQAIPRARTRLKRL